MRGPQAGFRPLGKEGKAGKGLGLAFLSLGRAGLSPGPSASFSWQAVQIPLEGRPASANPGGEGRRAPQRAAPYIKITLASVSFPPPTGPTAQDI